MAVVVVVVFEWRDDNARISEEEIEQPELASAVVRPYIAKNPPKKTYDWHILLYKLSINVLVFPLLPFNSSLFFLLLLLLLLLLLPILTFSILNNERFGRVLKGENARNLIIHTAISNLQLVQEINIGMQDGVENLKLEKTER